MKFSSTVVSLVSILALTACSPQGKPPIPSPDGSLTLHTTVESSRSNPTDYGCVIIEIRDKSAKVLHRENSGASAFQRWNITWVSTNKIKLTSSDIGTTTWTKQPDATWRNNDQIR